MIQALNTLLDALPTDPRSVQPFTQEVTVEVNNLGQELVNFIDKGRRLQNYVRHFG